MFSRRPVSAYFIVYLGILLNECYLFLEKKIHNAFSRIMLWRTSKLCASVCNVTVLPSDDFRTFKKPYSSIPMIVTFSCHLSTKTSLFLQKIESSLH